MVGNDLLFFRTNDGTLTLVARNNHLNGFLQISLLHHLALQLHRPQGALVDNVGQLGAASTGGSPGQSLKVNIISHLYALSVHPQNSLATLQIRQLHRNAPVKASRA